MGDIFDDVEKLIAEENQSKAEVTPTVDDVASEEISMEASDETTAEATDESQIFNDSELEDIMAEIESLESDFETTTTPEAVEEEVVENHVPKEELKLDSSTMSKTDLQLEIEKEIAMIDSAMIESTTDDSETLIASVATPVEVTISNEESANEEIPEIASSVLPFEKKVVEVKSFSPTTTNSKSEMSFQASGTMNLNLSFKVGSDEAKLYIDEVKGLVITLSGVEVCLNETNGCSVTMENGINFNIPLTSKESSSKKKSA